MQELDHIRTESEGTSAMRSHLFASTLAIALGIGSPIVSAIAFPEVAVAQSVAEQKKEADRLFSLGLKKNEEIEKLKESSRNLYEEDIELRDKFPEKWQNNLRLKSKKIFNQVNKIRAEIVRDYLRSLVIYQESQVKMAFPLKSLQGKQKIVIELIEIDFDDRIGSEKSSYLIEPQIVRRLVTEILEIYQKPDFRILFPLESHSGEQTILIKLMNPSNRFPSLIIREEIFKSQEVLKLLEQVLDNSRNTNFRDKFPLESRLGEQKVLTELSPYDRSIYQRRYLLSPQKRLNFWQNLKDSYLDPKFVSAFPKESRQGEGNALIKMGRTSLFEMNQPKQAFNFLKQGSSIARETGDLLLVSETMDLIISVYWNLGEYQEVIQSYEEFGRIIREISVRIIDKSDPIINEKLLKLNAAEPERLVKELQKLEFSWTYSTATAYLALGEPKRATELYQKFFAATKDNPELNSFRRGGISNLGIAYWLSGQYEEAVKIYTQLHNSGFSYYPLDYSLIMVGRGYNNIAKYKQVIDFYEQELKKSQQDSSYNLQIASLYNLGIIYTNLGQYQKAIEIYNQSLLLVKKPSTTDGASWEGIILSDLGNIYLKQGENAQAIKSFEQSLPLIQKVIHQQVSVRSIYNYDAYNTGEHITRKVILRYWEGGLLSNLGVAYSKLGQYPKASNFLRQSLLISREVGDRSTESMTLGNLGSIDVEIGKEQQARERYQQALTIAQNLGLREQESLLLDKIARLLEKQKEPELAIAFYKQSVNVRETIRQDIAKLPRESQESYTKSVADTYRSLANLLIQQRRLPEAQAVLELLKIRELRDFTRDTRAIDSPGISLAKIEKAALTEILTSFSTIGQFTEDLQKCEKDNCPTLKELETKRDRLNNAITQELKTQRKLLADHYATESATLTPEALNAEARRIVNAKEGTVLIYPLILKDKLQFLLAFKSNKGGVTFRPFESAITAEQLTTTITRFRNQLEKPGDIQTLKTTSQTLYNALIKPLEPELKAANIKHLVFAPDSTIRYIPLAALHDGKNYLIERYTISTITAASKTDTQERSPIPIPGQNQLLAMGASTFPNTAFSSLLNVPIELDAITQTPTTTGIYPGTEVLDRSFNFDSLKTNLKTGTYKILHLATHGAFIPGNVEQSYIVPGSGPNLTTDSIDTLANYGLGNLHLVVLSACQTGVGDRASDGIEIPGISHFFLKNDVKSVLASLWNVSDASTALLMQKFYTYLAQGKTKAEALQQVQTEFLNSKLTTQDLPRAGVRLYIPGQLPPDSLAHPYYWAPFILIGNSL